MQADAQQRAKQFNLQIEQSRASTQQAVDAASQAQAQAEAQATQQKNQSALMIQQQQLQAAVARQGSASPVTRAKRTAKRATPESMRTKVSLDTYGSGGSPGGGTSATGVGALNV